MHDLLYRDIHAPIDLLPAVAKARHWQGELILLISTLEFWDMATNVVMQLKALGMQHYIVVGNQEAATFAARSRRVAAVWSSLFERFNRLAPNGEPSANAFYGLASHRQLWFIRQHYVARLIGLQYNTLLLEADVIVMREPYSLLHRHFADYAALSLHDAGAGPFTQVNSGTWYVMARPNGPVHRLFARVFEYAFEILEAYYQKVAVGERPLSFNANDQHVINVLLMCAALGRGWHKPSCRSLLQSRSQYEIVLNATDLAAVKSAFTSTCCNASPPELARAVADVGEPPAPRRRTVQRRWMQYGPVYGMRTMRLGSSGDTELIGKAPAWLFSAESDQDTLAGRVSASLWGAARPATTIVHLVCSTWPGADGRRQAMMLWDHWHWQNVSDEVGDSFADLPPPVSAPHVAFSAPLRANSPAALNVHLRLLALLALLTERVPVLPLVECTVTLPDRSPTAASRDRAPEGESPGWVAADPFAFDATRSRACGWAVHHVGARALRRTVCVMRIFEFCLRVFAMPTALPWEVSSWWRQDEAAVGVSGTSPSAHQLIPSRGDGAKDKLGLSEALLNLAARVNASAGSKVVLVDAPLDAVRELQEVSSTPRFQHVFGALLRRSRTVSVRHKHAWAECAKRMLVPARCAPVWC